MTRRGKFVIAQLTELTPPPTCNACGERMWWHGGTVGWGCPDMHGGSPDCRSSLYRPLRDPDVWEPHRERYPELAEDDEGKAA